jgi:hypothetical protein
MGEASFRSGLHADLSAVLAAQRLFLPGFEEMEAPDAFTAYAPIGEFAVAERCGALVGGGRFSVAAGMKAAAFDACGKLFAAAEGWEIAREWCVIPEVNRVVNGLENYRAFNVGRARAYEERFGTAANSRLPAATGIGGYGDLLHVSFVAVKGPFERFENPSQVPAWLYPKEYGPRPPCFARATLCEIGGAKVGFVSGTAAVKGSESVARSPAGECAAAIDNLRIMEEQLVAAGLGANAVRHVNIFIRPGADSGFFLDLLSRYFARPGDHVRVFRSEICRAELSLEIEFTAVSAAI